MKTTRRLFAGLSLSLVLGVVAWEMDQLTSPGPLHASHQGIPELERGRGCVSCHGAGAGVGAEQNVSAMADACVTCHHEVKDQLDYRRGLHGSLERFAALACGACHNEHSDGSLDLVSEQSFESAGVPDPNVYDHKDVTGFRLEGRHDDLRCVQCHVRANVRQLAKGQKRYLGLSQDCVSCHTDTHEGSFGADCVSCHGQAHGFKEAAGFAHTGEFPLEGGHGGLRCDACHDRSSDHSVGGLRALPSFVVRECVGCHADAHEGALGPDCASCHGTTFPFDHAAEFKHTEEFPLRGGHAARACKECHEQSGPYSVAALKDHPLPVRRCGDCHASPHRAPTMARLARTLERPELDTCAQCHRTDDATFLGPKATMTPDQHAATGFSLELPHDKAECVKCHEGFGARGALEAGPDLKDRFAAIFPGRSAKDCAACHKDPHQGQFADGPTKGRCVECHATTHFTPSGYDQAQHAKTRFPLAGSHQAVGCVLCHKKADGIVRFVPTPAACADCHREVHDGRFDRPGRPVKVDGREGCARCHTVTGFGEITWSARDHGLWTDYDLKGAHADATCVECHKRRALPDERGRTLGAAPTACADCHTDPHAGQLARQNVTDCSRCHSEGEKFKQTIFDHQRDSEFTLDEHHVTLECAACHKPVELAPGVAVVRYRPMGTRCQDCHGPGVTDGKERP